LKKQKNFISEMKKGDLHFLIELWHNRKVMRYADEFPRIRGWSKSVNPELAWKKYQNKRSKLGTNYTQMILRLKDNTPIGESFFGPLPEGYTFGKWRKPDNVICLMSDIKLLPRYWNQGLGTEGMKRIVEYVFTKTNCQLFVVPSNIKNPAAIRVYEKAGFVHYTGMKSYRNHKIMEMTKERFKEIYEN